MKDTNSQDAQECSNKPSVENNDNNQSAYTCELCQCCSTFASGFQKSKSKKTKSDSYRCTTCIAYQESDRSRLQGNLAMIGLLVFSLAIASHEVAQTALFFAKWLTACFFFAHIAILVHELGHYSATRLVGSNIRMMILGSGPVLKVLRLNQLFLVIKLLPGSGAVCPELLSANNIRKKYAFIIFSGPLANLLMAIFAILIIYNFETSMSPLSTQLLWLWLIINFFIGIVNLIPSRNITIDGFANLQSDGACLLDLPSWNDEQINTFIRHTQCLVAQIEFTYGDKRRARTIAIDAIDSGQDAKILSCIVSSCSHTDDELAFSIQLNRQIIEQFEHNEHNDQEDQITALVRNNLAYNLFQCDDPSLLPEADEQSQKAMETLPMYLSVRGTRGSVLVAKGQHIEGLKLLEDKRFSIETKEHQSSVLRVRARAYRKLGRDQDAAECLDKAEQLYPALGSG